MTEVIVFPDAEAVLVAALKPVLGVPVVTRVPVTRPPSFVRLVRVGGSEPNLITDRATVVFECWAENAPDASDLASLTRGHVKALVPDSFRRYRLIAGPQSFPDPASETPRYQFTVQLDQRGYAL